MFAGRKFVPSTFIVETNVNHSVDVVLFMQPDELLVIHAFGADCVDGLHGYVYLNPSARAGISNFLSFLVVSIGFEITIVLPTFLPSFCTFVSAILSP